MRSHLLQMRGLKPVSLTFIEANPGRIFYRCVDWNYGLRDRINDNISRIFYRCVDWNPEKMVYWTFGYVASFTDAWIETYFRSREQYLKTSHLLQMRGLKHGLNLRWFLLLHVASFTDAWIETLMYANWQSDAYVASFTDAWIETISEGVIDKPEMSHLLQMRGLKQICNRIKRGSRRSHLLQMRGLKQ